MGKNTLPIASFADWKLRFALERNFLLCHENSDTELYDCYLEFLDSKRWIPEIMKYEGKVGLYDPCHEKVLLPVIFEDLGEIDDLEYWWDKEEIRKEQIVCLHGKWGVIRGDEELTMIVPIEYEAVSKLDDAYLCQKDGKHGLWSRGYRNTNSWGGARSQQPKELLPCIADKIQISEDRSKFLFSVNGVVHEIESGFALPDMQDILRDNDYEILTPEDTLLPVYLAIPSRTSMTSADSDEPLHVYIAEQINKEASLSAITLEDSPIILDSNYKSFISEEGIRSVIIFLKANMSLFQAFAKGDISLNDLVNEINHPTSLPSVQYHCTYSSSRQRW